MRRLLALALLATSPALAQSSALQAGRANPITAQERSQGARADPGIVAEYGGALTGRQAAYVQAIGRRIAVQSGLAANPGAFDVTLLDSSVDNAFAIPGGYVYVTRNLVALMNDEAELAAVMGHEVAHVAARHSRQRQGRATRNAVGGSILQGIIGAVTGNSAIGSLLGRGVGAAAQLDTLGFSRGQETQADDLAVRYLAGAGYDPLALSTMLMSLADQTALNQAMSGSAQNLPRWASTHPDPGARVRRAEQQAAQVGTVGRLRNRDAFLAAINGMPYGDDPAQGVVNGQRFIHPSLGLAFEAPAGFTIRNGADAVAISGRGAQGRFSAARFSGPIEDYVAQVLGGLGVTAPPPERTVVNGIPAAYAQVTARSGSTPVDVTVFAYQLSRTQAAHFITLAPAGQGAGPLESLFDSVGRLTSSDASALRPRFIRVVTVRAGDTPQSLSARMAYPDHRLDRFLILNRLDPDAPLRPGDKVKLVSY